ncbi:MAG: hypothetical protein NG747_06400 [Candidatus Brocadia sp.]|nr:hypothetical protein [Candidatus Brocadia sp.]
MKIKSYIIFIVACAFISLSGCAQYTLTGQNSLWKIKETPQDNTSALHELAGIYTSPATATASAADRGIKNESDVIAISLKTLYLKYIQSVHDFDVIVYAEVYDVVDETKALKRIAFQRLNQPPNSYLNIAGNLLYGPLHFNGDPITVKLYIFELDKKDNEILSEFLKTASSIASAAQPQYGPAIEIASSIMQYIISANQDDLEFSQEITFCPTSTVEEEHYGGNASLVAPLEAGDVVIVKREDKDRVVINRWWWFDTKSGNDAKDKFKPEDVRYDVATGRLKYARGDSKGEDFEGKTYAVLTVSKPPKAVERDVLEQISTDVQSTLDGILIKSDQTQEDKIAAIRNMGASSEATIRIFNIKNRITGKSPAEKEAMLNEFLNDMTGTTPTKADEIVKREIERLLREEVEIATEKGTETANMKKEEK